MRVVFADTVGLLAIWDERDQWHSKASNVYAELLTAKTRLITTSFVLLECGNAAARRPYRDSVVQLRQRLLSKGLLITPSEADCEVAWSDFARRQPSTVGIVDQISFEVMRRFGIREAFTNDQHFTAAGFQVLF
jgi:predicted nucleic acid-binding protein